jgi:tetratricopeptide (TPR) repeat protein
MKNNFDHIERFFNGAMDQKEIAEFEKQRSLDKEFAKEILLYKQAKDLVQAGARKRLKGHLDNLGQKELAFTMIDAYSKYYLLKKYWYAAAASILIVIGLSYFAYHNIIAAKSLPTLAQLYDSNFEVPKADLVISRGDNSEETLSYVWNSAIQKYSEERFEDAIEDLKVVLANSKFTHTSAANFYLGICYLKINLPDSAIAKFSIVSPTSSLSQDASWYLGLSYLKAGNFQSAAEVFENIAELQKHYKKKQAKEIFELLSRKK